MNQNMSNQTTYNSNRNKSHTPIRKRFKWLFHYLDAPIYRVSSLDTPIPFANNLEEFWDIVSKGKAEFRSIPKERLGQFDFSILYGRMLKTVNLCFGIDFLFLYNKNSFKLFDQQ